MIPAECRHVIWDWNGTLLDDAWLCRDIMNGMLRRRDMPTLTEERYRDLFDFPVIDYYRRVGFDFERESFEELGTEFIVEYERRRLEAGLQEGARETLETLRRRGVTQSVLSAYKQNTLEEMVSYFGLRDYFLALIGLNDHYAAGKLENARQWIARLDYGPHEVMLIGDTVHDHEVAREIGVDCVLLACGHHSEEKLKTCGVPVLNSLGSLVQTGEKG